MLPEPLDNFQWCHAGEIRNTVGWRDLAIHRRVKRLCSRFIVTLLHVFHRSSRSWIEAERVRQGKGWRRGLRGGPNHMLAVSFGRTSSSNCPMCLLDLTRV